MPLCLLVWTK
ncbi:hypothetical protein F383_16274 [Gossypium arboreum]|uniref:Uncharacterized protein n=1 Tax=Gossypium arboreum TaxID=29729 RepID=A0A0B0PZ80_GOSAR|nr:hypothetical protein F383_16274 [Gossypium arboreum]